MLSSDKASEFVLAVGVKKQTKKAHSLKSESSSTKLSLMLDRATSDYVFD